MVIEQNLKLGFFKTSKARAKEFRGGDDAPLTRFEES